MKRITMIFALFPSASFLQAKPCEDLQKGTSAAVLLQAMQGNRGAHSLMYPLVIACGTQQLIDDEENPSEETKKSIVENSGAKSYKDFIMIWRHIYDANLKVAKEIASSGEGKVPGVVPCKVNDNLRELMGNKLWNKLRLQLTTEGFDRETTSMILLPKDVCNKYSKIME